ncbi:MAG: hypothetical protein SH809_06055 [Rhodothermales bacterium]|nr:hypothetical protein [Rhodothermales bacterium]
MLLVLIGGGVLSPTVHILLHDVANAHGEWDPHADVESVTVGNECSRPHAPERPCIFCTQISIYAGVLSDPPSVWLPVGTLTVPAGLVHLASASLGEGIRGPPAYA